LTSTSLVHEVEGFCYCGGDGGSDGLANRRTRKAKTIKPETIKPRWLVFAWREQMRETQMRL
jgi:hypothetical protein